MLARTLPILLIGGSDVARENSKMTQEGKSWSRTPGLNVVDREAKLRFFYMGRVGKGADQVTCRHRFPVRGGTRKQMAKVIGLSDAQLEGTGDRRGVLDLARPSRTGLQNISGLTPIGGSGSREPRENLRSATIKKVTTGQNQTLNPLNRSVSMRCWPVLVFGSDKV